jgi:hypothetical protein
MKTLILLACCIGLLSACSPGKSPWEGVQQIAPSQIAYEVATVDGCEYISIAGKYGFSHKGNCKNPIHNSK